MSKKRPRHSRSSGTTPPLRHEFNERATEVSEVEIKFLVKNNDPAVFSSIVDYFARKGMIRSRQEGKHLLTWQLDTPDGKLLDLGLTLRARGECEDNDLTQIKTVDVCLKTDKQKDDSGALRRGEYEAKVNKFANVSIDALLKKYPEEKYPEVHAALKEIKDQDLVEYFRIDCIRNRYLVEIPEKDTGLKGKRCFAELILDDVAFVFDAPELDKPLIFGYDMEVECEVMFKACSFDPSPDATKNVSSPMTKAETNQAMEAIRTRILKSAPGTLVENFDSKAERGFSGFKNLMNALKRYLQPAGAEQPGVGVDKPLPLAFRLSGCDSDGNLETPDGPYNDIYHLLPERFGFVLERHNVAHRKPAPPQLG